MTASNGPAMGIVATGSFLPETTMSAADVAEASGLPEWVVRDKLGIRRKHVPDPAVQPNDMALEAARRCLASAEVDPGEVDVVLCTTEEWKEYSLWTAGIDLAHRLGADRAWGMDVHMRCATTIAALKLARALMREDPGVETVLIAGGYAVGDFIDYTNADTSFLFNIGAGAGAMLVQRDWPRNRVLGSHLISDGSMSRHVVVPASGTVEHPSDEAVAAGRFKFDLVAPEAMKARLGEVSIDNWMTCVDEALAKSGPGPGGEPLSRADLDYLNLLLVKPSAHRRILELLGIPEGKSVYLGDVGHIGEQDAILSIIEGERRGRLADGDLMAILGAGIGYVWGAAIVRWGEAT